METEMKDGKQDEAHGERHADAIGLHPNRICMNTRDRRRALRISVAVLTTKTNMAAVRLWVEQLWRIRHLQLQGSADDADPMLRTSAPNRSESGEDDFAHKKIKEYGARQVRSEQDAVPLKELHDNRLPQGYC